MFFYYTMNILCTSCYRGNEKKRNTLTCRMIELSLAWSNASLYIKSHSEKARFDGSLYFRRNWILFTRLKGH